VLLEATTDGFGVHHDADATDVRVMRRLARAGPDSPDSRGDDRGLGDPGLDDRGLVVAAEPASVPVCRRFVRERLVGAPPPLVDNAELCVSELVTNAVLHAGTDIEVRVEPAADTCRLEVRDANPVPPLRHHHTEGATTGRGLEMVSGVARAWGISPLDRGGKAVWCEVTADPPGELTDPEQLLARWAEADAAPAEAGPDRPPSLVLRRYPVHLGARARDHVESLVRECLLAREPATGAPATGAPPDRPRLVALAETLRGYVGTLDAVEPQRVSGCAQQRFFVDAAVPAVHPVAQARAWREALAELDGYADRGQLLTPPMPPDVAAVHRWALDEITVQSGGIHPRAWDGPLT
jgi:hypothetical protein